MADPLAGVDVPALFKRMSLYAARRLGKRATLEEGEDLAAEALRQLYDPEFKDWDPTKQSIEDFLGSTINGLVQNRRRRKAPQLLEGAEDLEAVAGQSSAASPAEVVERKLDGREAMNRLLESIKDDPLVTEIVMLQLDGVEDPKIQAERFGRPRKDIYNARRRLETHLEALRRVWEDDNGN
jgi:DNA-directed RNA polymerase specialized sigma24 family protein